MTLSSNSLRGLDGAQEWTVTINQQGRSGTVTYKEAGNSIPMSWEFGGNNVVAVISFGDVSVWRLQHPWAAERRSEILGRVAAEVIRQRAPGCRAEIHERSSTMVFIQSSPTGASVPPQTEARAWRARRTKIMGTLVVMVLVCAAAAVAFKTLFSVRTAGGNPLGLSVRTPEHIATLVESLESYIPSLHRNPENDRYRLSLFLTPMDGRSPGKMIPVAQHRRAQEFQLTKLLGCDGTTVWFNLDGAMGVNLKSGRIVDAKELRRINSSLNEAWDDPRRIEFDQRLRVTTADRKQVYEVTPDTLQAVPATPRATKYPFDPKPQDFLSAGVRPTPTEWLGVVSAKAAAVEYKPKSWLSRLNRSEEAKEQRSFYRAKLGPEVDRGHREILSLERVANDEYFNAAFLRAEPDADPLRLSDPESFLMIYTSHPGLNGTLVVARVDAAGKVLWKTDTGIDRFKLAQILPDARFPAFIGPRPPVPNQVSEPMLVVIDPASGAVSTNSLSR